MFGRRSLTILLALAAALISVAPAVAGGKPGGGAAAEPPTDQIVVKMAAGKSLDTSSLDATAGVNVKQLRRLSDGSYVLKLPKRHDADAVRAITDRLAARGDVLSAEPDALMQPLAAIPSDSSWPLQWDMFNPATGNYGINLLPAWDITTGSAAIRIGVIDTGYRPHIDLANRFTPGYDFITDVATANDGDGRDSDPSDPGDWITPAEANGPFFGCGSGNSSWHGTHVAGTIGAVANNNTFQNQNVVGINQGSLIQPLRVLGKCGGYTSDIADAIRWAAGIHVTGVPDNPTPDRVVNISLGGSGACGSTFQNAITTAVNNGTVVVVAAGNSNANAANFTPANCSGVVTVAATGHTGSRAYYSNFGTSVEIAAPGGDGQLFKTILSTLNAGTQGPGADSYANYQGTSMATPHVVGVVSLMLSANPGLTPAQVTSILQSTATAFPPGSTCTVTTCGGGIVNAGAAVAAANGGGGLPAPGGFNKTAPVDGAPIAGTSTTLSWGTSSNAAGFEYCLSTIGPSCTSWTSAGTLTSVALSGLTPGATYSWQVRATNATSTTMANGGTWWTFTTQAPPPPPPSAFSKTLPANGATNQKRSLSLKWGRSTNASSYEWCLSTSQAPCTSWNTTTALSASVSGLASKVTYYWQVRAKNAAGVTTDATGGFWSFRTR